MRCRHFYDVPLTMKSENSTFYTHLLYRMRNIEKRRLMYYWYCFYYYYYFFSRRSNIDICCFRLSDIQRNKNKPSFCPCSGAICVKIWFKNVIIHHFKITMTILRRFDAESESVQNLFRITTSYTSDQADSENMDSFCYFVHEKYGNNN